MLEDIRQERIKKRQNLQSAGFDPYPANVKRTATNAEIIKDWSKFVKKTTTTIVGRVFAVRGQGKLIFLDVKDESAGIQIVFKQDSGKNFELVRDNLDIGDFVQASGKCFVTKRGEKSIEAKELLIIIKALRPIPSEYYGVTDPETRQRQRYLELLINPEVKESFYKKATFWNTWRTIMLENGFLEVETPALEHIPGGADAEPFITHHNALDIEMYLRISLEISLKKLMVGGYERVFEIGRIFRNEGIDAEHLQDYTQIEFYWAYQNYEGLMSFIEKAYKRIIKATTGSLKTKLGDSTIVWARAWPRIDYFAFFKKETGLDLDTINEKELTAYAKSKEIDTSKHLGRGRLIDAIFKRIRPKLIQPCFLINQPIEVEPLAKRIAPDSNKVARFQILAGGTELGKGFAELNDPIDQMDRFKEQQKLREAGDTEAQRLDESFIEAMEYGMPPMAGFGISERLFSVLMNKPIRETVFFPTLRPKN